jgi:hypothetical protein
MKKFLFLILLIAFLLVPAVFAGAASSGSCMVSYDPALAFDPFTRSMVVGQQIVWTCTASASGAVTSPTLTDTSGNAYTMPAVSGRIARIRIISGAGLSAGNVTLYSSEDANSSDDILQGLGATISTSNGNVKTDVPITTTGKMPREIQQEVLTPAGSGLGNGGVFTLKVLFRW